MTNQPSVKQIVMLVGIVILTVLPTVIYGRFTNRWGRPANLKAAADRLQRCPEKIGDWTVIAESNDLSDFVLRELQIAGYFKRTYANQNNGNKISVIMMVGSPGALSRHPPEICYEGKNQRVGEPEQVSVEDGQKVAHQFRLLEYRQRGEIGQRFKVCYGFSTDGAWSSPDQPRLMFGGKRLLYKFQAISGQADTQDGQLPAATSDFLRQFLPAFRDACITKASS